MTLSTIFRYVLFVIVLIYVLFMIYALFLSPYN